jgi:hypothetical protein
MRTSNLRVRLDRLEQALTPKDHRERGHGAVDPRILRNAGARHWTDRVRAG